MEEKKLSVEINFSLVVKTVIFLLLLLVLYQIRDIVAVVLFSIVIAAAVEPATLWFEKKHIPRVIAVIMIYFVAFLVLGAVFYLIVPVFIDEVSNFSELLPRYLGSSGETGILAGFFPGFSETITKMIAGAAAGLKEQLAGFALGFLDTAVRIFGGAVSFMLIVVLSFYLAVQRNGLENFIRIVTPAKYEDNVLNLWERTRKKIGLWLQGQILLGVLVGVLVYLGLTILRVDYALTFALLAAVFEIIPIFGPILSAIPPVMLALLESPTRALVVASLYFVIQQFENHLIYPLVVRKIVGVPPLLAILALLVGGKLGGFFGMLLGVPVATALKEFLNDLADKKRMRSAEK